MDNNRLVEPCIEELTNGKLIMTLRNMSGKIIFVFSEDKGLTWSGFVKSQISSPDAPPVISRIPGRDELVLIWNNNERINDYQFRSPLSLAISRDNGINWIYKFDIENKKLIGAYYPTIDFTSDKLIITYSQRITNARITRITSIVISELPIDSLIN